MVIRKKKIKTMVEKLLDELNVTAPPVPVQRLAKACNIRILRQSLDADVSGFLYREGRHAVIGVNTYHAPVRQRFTVAHEIGHYLLHSQEQVHVDRSFEVKLRGDLSSQGVDRDEIEANVFAAELLMPRALLAADLPGSKIDLFNENDLKRLAKRYKVSTQALLIRLTTLGFLQH